jgi:site-specific DNA-cytosine methylase
VPTKVMEKSSSWCFDIVSPESTHSACFTKAYSRYVKGTGSVLLVAGELPVAQAAAGVSDGDEGGEGEEGEKHSTLHDAKRLRLDAEEGTRLEVLDDGTNAGSSWSETCKSLQLRYFSPEELLHMFGFPQSLSYPVTVTRRKMYELIGNSLNVKVAGSLLKFLFASSSSDAADEERRCNDDEPNSCCS